MLDKTQISEAEIELNKTLAIAIRVGVAIGTTRQVELTTGVPLSWGLEGLNDVIDICTKAADRQQDRYAALDDVKGLKARLQQALHGLETQREQRQQLEARFVSEHMQRGKRGDFAAGGSQQQQLDNYSKTITEFERQIPLIREELQAALAKVGAEG